MNRRESVEGIAATIAVPPAGSAWSAGPDRLERPMETV
jgi:hypothetical protein